MVHGRFSRYLIVFLLLAGFCSLPSLAQRITGDIAGEVTDSTGAVLPNVTVLGGLLTLTFIGRASHEATHRNCPHVARALKNAPLAAASHVRVESVLPVRLAGIPQRAAL